MSYLTFGENVRIGQLFDYKNLQFDSNLLNNGAFETVVDVYQKKVVKCEIIKDVKSLLDVLNIKEHDLLKLFLSDSLKDIKEFIIPPAEEYVLCIYEQNLVLNRIEFKKVDDEYVNMVQNGIIVMLHVIPKRKNIELQCVKSFLKNVNNEFNCLFIKSEDYIINTMLNWKISKNHKTFKDAFDYIKVVTTNEFCCDFRYMITENQNKIKKMSNNVLNYMNSLYIFNYKFNNLKKILEISGMKIDVLEQNPCDDLSNILRKLLEDDVFKLKTIGKFFKDLKDFINMLDNVYETLLKYLKNQLKIQYNELKFLSYFDSLQIYEYLQKLLMNVDKLYEYEFKIINNKILCLIDNPNMNFKCKKMLIINNEQYISLFLDDYEIFEDNGFFIAVCKNGYNYRNEKLLIKIYDKLYNCGYIYTSSNTLQPYKGCIPNNLYFKKCQCGTNCNGERLWICYDCKQLVTVPRKLFTSRLILYCLCGKRYANSCKFECFNNSVKKKQSGNFFMYCNNSFNSLKNFFSGTSRNEKEELMIYEQSLKNEDEGYNSLSYWYGDDKRENINENFLNNGLDFLFDNKKYTESKNINVLHQQNELIYNCQENTSKISDEFILNPYLVNETFNDQREKDNHFENDKIEFIKNTDENVNMLNHTLFESKKEEQKLEKKIDEGPKIDWISTQKHLKNENDDDDTMNIILVGKHGVGKSTLINSFNNYCKNRTNEEAEESKLEPMIPVYFSVFKEDYTYDYVSINIDNDDNEKPHDLMDTNQSTTQKCKSYMIEYGFKRFKFIDTPGITSDNNEKVLNELEGYMKSLNRIHGICFVLKPNESKIDQLMENFMKELVVFLPEQMLDKIFFFMTHSMGTFYGPGDSMQPLNVFAKNLKEKHQIEIKLKKENIFCFDNEGFKYLCAKDQKVDYNILTEEDYITNWDKSKESMERFMDIVCKKKEVNFIKIKQGQLLFNVVNEMKNVRKYTTFEKLPKNEKDDMNMSYYFCLKMLIRLGMSNDVQKFLKELQVDSMLTKCGIPTDFIITDETIKIGVELFLKRSYCSRQCDAYLKWFKELNQKS